MYKSVYQELLPSEKFGTSMGERERGDISEWRLGMATEVFFFNLLKRKGMGFTTLFLHNYQYSKNYILLASLTAIVFLI